MNADIPTAGSSNGGIPSASLAPAVGGDSTPVDRSANAAMSSALQKVREIAPQLNPTMRRVAEAILADPLRAGTTSITALAAAAGASPAAVSRLANRLGYAGFPALRSAVALDNGRRAQSGWERDIGAAINPDDSPADVLDILAGTAARSLREAAGVIDVDQMEHAANAVARAERIYLYGEWGDSIAVRELHMRLLRTGVAAWFLEAGPNTLRAVCNTLTDRDVVLALGRSGRDEVGVHFLRRARSFGAITVALHGDGSSPLAAAADIPLYTGISNGSVWTQYYAGRASDVLATSFLWLLVAQIRSADPAMRYVDDDTSVEPSEPPHPYESVARPEGPSHPA